MKAKVTQMEQDVVKILIDIQEKVTRVDERTLNQEKDFEDLSKRVKTLEEKEFFLEGKSAVKIRSGNMIWDAFLVIITGIITWISTGGCK
jgi:hypothetical protein